MNYQDPNTSFRKEIIARKIQGVVKWYNVKCGYGFINRNDNKEDVFIHQTGILKYSPVKFQKSVGDGEVVEFDLVLGLKGLEAVNVTGPNGRPVKGSRYAASRRFTNFYLDNPFINPSSHNNSGSARSVIESDDDTDNSELATPMKRQHSTPKSYNSSHYDPLLSPPMLSTYPIMDMYPPMIPFYGAPYFPFGFMPYRMNPFMIKRGSKSKKFYSKKTSNGDGQNILIQNFENKDIDDISMRFNCMSKEKKPLICIDENEIFSGNDIEEIIDSPEQLIIWSSTETSPVNYNQENHPIIRSEHDTNKPKMNRSMSLSKLSLKPLSERN